MDGPTLLEREDGRPMSVAVRAFALRVVEGADRGTRATFEGRPIGIGTEPTATLRLKDEFVSRIHAEVSVGDHGFLLSDLGSKNGTFLGENRVLQAYLERGDRIRVGHSTLVFEVLDEAVRIPLAAASRFGGLVGESVAMRGVFETLERVAPTPATVLLGGETGTGKEKAARAIHERSPRAGAPFVVVDCGAMPASLLAAELFGHERGAFTGAEQSRAGAFERATGGTVLLDEVGELALDLQPQLLRVLESREVRRIGGNAYLPVDVRILAATNRDLRADVNQGRFRADLYFRLAVVEVRLPAIREHLEDMPLLVAELLEEISARTGVPCAPPGPEEIERLSRHYWPGNVRELRNVLERGVLLEAGLDVPKGEPAPPVAAPASPPVGPFAKTKADVVRRFERAYVEALLEKTGGNVAKAAREGRMNRAYLIRLMKKHKRTT
jgi:transcriptional regulator with GAF, ATPase, and Fis domain